MAARISFPLRREPPFRKKESMRFDKTSFFLQVLHSLFPPGGQQQKKEEDN
jgi:hypothetical protein